MINVWYTVSIFTPFFGCFCLWTLFLINGLDNAQCSSFISHLHTERRITSRKVWGFATDYVWGCGWTICIQYDCPLWGLCFKLTVPVCKSGIVERTFLLISCLCALVYNPSFACYFIHLSILLWNSFFFHIEYFVLPYSIDLAATLSYLYRWSRCSIGYPMTRYCTLTHTFLPYCFSAQIVVRRPVANFAWCQ